MVRIMHWLGQNKGVPRPYAHHKFSLVDMLGVIYSYHGNRKMTAPTGARMGLALAQKAKASCEYQRS